MNTRKMARKLAAHGASCAEARRGSGQLVPCTCKQTLAWRCACGKTVVLRGGACDDWRTSEGAYKDLVVY